jgi:hypothetical protein
VCTYVYFFCLFSCPSNQLGVHHNDPEKTLAPNLESLFRWNSEISSHNKPILLWRETTPQHFPTISGTFEKDNMKKCHRVSETNCKAIISKSRPGSKQKFNDLSNPRVQAAGIPIVEVFDVMKPFWFLHQDCIGGETAPDCTHSPLTSPLNRFVVLETIAAIDKEMEIKNATNPQEP